MSKIYLTLVLFAFSLGMSAQTTMTNKKGGKWQFNILKRYDTMPVQNQANSGTCWSFSALSFFESEAMRMSKGKANLSEMFVVNHAYRDKAEMYVRMHGTSNFGQGGAFHDAKYVIKKYGAIPEEAYVGLAPDEKNINHNELEKAVTGYMKTVVEAPNGKLTSSWKKVLGSMIDGYLGTMPENFNYQGKSYTPQTYSQSLGLNMDDYVEIGSYTHHPFYSKFILEVPDNWMYDQVYNVPLDEFAKIIESALMNGYTVAWASDVSEKTFSFTNGVAVVPDVDITDMTKAEIEELVNTPGKQLKITQELRQKSFDNYDTQDDHGMHIIGLAKDELGQTFYLVKNSWGTKRNDCDGYFFASEAFVLYKSTSIMIHKNAIPKDIAVKLGL